MQIKSYIFPISFFIIFSLYLLSSATNFLLFHFILDINVAKVGLLLMTLSLCCWIQWSQTKLYWKKLRFLIFFVGIWITYQCINGLVGDNSFSAFKLCLRFFNSWIIAFLLAILLIQKKEKIELPFILALSFSFCIMVSLIYIQDHFPHWLSFFENKFPTKIYDGLSSTRKRGLYLNPNEASFAFLSHTMLLLWYLVIQKRNIFFSIIPFCVLIYLLSKTKSLNGFVGFGFICLFFTWNLIQIYIKNKSCQKYIKLISIILFIPSFIFLSYILPYRTQQKFDSIKKNISTFLETNKADIPRVIIWKMAYHLWKENPIFGIGVDSLRVNKDIKFIMSCIHIKSISNQFCINNNYINENYFLKKDIQSIKHPTIQYVDSNLQGSYNSHSFIYGILIEQGIIGLLFFIVFIIYLIRKMKHPIASNFLLSFLFFQLFDDMTYSYTLPIYCSILFATCFMYILGNINTDDKISARI